MQRAGHDEPKTTLGYIREAESVRVAVGEPFPTLPSELLETPITASDKGLSDHTSTQVVGTSKVSQRPQGDTQVSAPGPFSAISSICDVFPPWLGGMTQEEAGLTLTLVATA